VPGSVAIREVGARERVDAEELVELLRDSVSGGASVGYLWPLDPASAHAYWRGVLGALDAGNRMWIARDGERIVGSVQLTRCSKPNGRHRAEVQKLLVHSRARRRGIGAQLLAAAEACARANGCTLLVLDTEAGSVAETMYRRSGWRKAGEIPNYAGKPSGELIPTAYYYKWLGAEDPAFSLVTPAREHLDSYVGALKAGWCADNMRPEARLEELDSIEKDADAFLAQHVDREAKGPPVTLPDGSQVRRLPGYRLWIWDGEFCGSIGFRWQPGTTALPPHVLGHIGYAVVPWKRWRGYATRALARMLENARKEGLAHVDITTDPENVASQRVIVANGGVLVERFVATPSQGAHPKLRYRIALEA
jgi:predicted acetyltransferase/L-amino acid N-acyltransferase YncA